MKKRKSPYLLVTLLTVFLLTAAGINIVQNNILGQLKLGTPPSQPATSGEQNKTPSKEEMAQSMKTQMAGGNPGGPGAGPAGGPTAGAPAGGPPKGGPPRGPAPVPGSPGSMVKQPKVEPFKPKPNDSSIAGQWYTDESGLKGK